MYPHVEHIQAHLERVRYGHLVDPSPESVYLGAEEGSHFWELVGFRLAGCPVVVLALLRFQKLDLPDVRCARESLSTYLSALPSPRAEDEAGALTAILPGKDETISYFLKRLRAGLKRSPVSLDVARIQVAFDFRIVNPTLVSSLRDGAEALRDHYYRTVDGHVIRGRSHEVPPTAPDVENRFMAISSPEQVMPTGVYPLPPIFVNRKYLALRVEASPGDGARAVEQWVPFLPEAATPDSLLPLPALPRAGASARF